VLNTNFAIVITKLIKMLFIATCNKVSAKTNYTVIVHTIYSISWAKGMAFG